MGFYIHTDRNKQKYEWILEKYPDSIKTNDPFAPPTGFIPVVIIDNGIFEAAGIAFDKQELQYFTDPEDSRPKKFLFVRTENIIKESPSVEEMLNWL